jgi:hypothetical protein
MSTFTQNPLGASTRKDIQRNQIAAGGLSATNARRSIAVITVRVMASQFHGGKGSLKWN